MKTVLDLMKDNYHTRLEALKLRRLFFKEPMIKEKLMFNTVREFSYAEMFNKLLLRKWKFRQTYSSVLDIMVQNGFNISADIDFSNEQLINFIELIVNILYCTPNIDFFLRSHNLFLDEEKYNFMVDVLNCLIKNLGITKKENLNGWIVLIPQNEALDKVIEKLESNVQWDVISYMKIRKNDLDNKRRHLAYLATELYIEKDEKEKDYEPFNIIMNECTLILNNLHIRHNNETGKYENEVVKTLDKNQALILCDMLYNKMLQIVLMRKDLKSQNLITNFSKSLKSKK